MQVNLTCAPVNFSKTSHRLVNQTMYPIMNKCPGKYYCLDMPLHFNCSENRVLEHNRWSITGGDTRSCVTQIFHYFLVNYSQFGALIFNKILLKANYCTCHPRGLFDFIL